MKTLALDIGDAWTGSALSDALGFFARPYKTVQTEDLKSFLVETLKKEPISTVVVGYPKTMRGTESEQTKKIKLTAHELELEMPNVKWVLWDERLSSKRADTLKRAKTKAEKIDSHSVAAAFILTSYLDFLHTQKAL